MKRKNLLILVAIALCVLVVIGIVVFTNNGGGNAQIDDPSKPGITNPSEDPVDPVPVYKFDERKVIATEVVVDNNNFKRSLSISGFGSVVSNGDDVLIDPFQYGIQELILPEVKEGYRIVPLIFAITHTAKDSNKYDTMLALSWNKPKGYELMGRDINQNGSFDWSAWTAAAKGSDGLAREHHTEIFLSPQKVAWTIDVMLIIPPNATENVNFMFQVGVYLIRATVTPNGDVSAEIFH